MVLRVMKAERSHQLLSPPVWDEAMLRQVSREVFEMLLRFNETPEGLREVINGIDDETKLSALHREAIQCASFEASDILIREEVRGCLRLEPIFPMWWGTLKRELRRRHTPTASESRLQPIFPMRQSTLKREIRCRDVPTASESRLRSRRGLDGWLKNVSRKGAKTQRKRGFWVF